MSTSDTHPGLALRLARRAHRVATAAYPRAFRRQFGRDLENVFTLRVEAAAARSALRAVALGTYLIVDAALSGVAERARARTAARERADHGGAMPLSRRFPVMLESLVTDCRLAIRQFRRAPAFALLTTLSLALGIGANTAIFSVINAVLLRPLPYADPDRLVAVWSDNTRQGQAANSVSPADFEAVKTAPSLSRAEAMFSFLTSAQIQVGGEADYVQLATITPGMFDLLGRQPIVGSVFRGGETTPRVVLGYGYWQRRFAGDPGVVGRTLTFPGTAPVAVAGVMPADFAFPYRSMLGPAGFTQALQPDMWLPLVTTPGPAGGRYFDASGQPDRTVHYLAVVGRLAPGMTAERARADLQAIAAKRALDFPDTNRGWRVTVRSLHDQTVGAVRPALLILLGGVGVVLLITCVNVANVMLARAGARRLDLAVRSALGATGARLTESALVESVMLGFAGGVAGLGLTLAGIQALVAMAPPNLPRLGEVSLDPRVSAFAIALSLGTGLIVGLVPAWTASRTPTADALRESRRTTTSRGRRRLRSGLIVAEVSLAMALAVGAGLLLRSFVAVLSVDPGFEAAGMLTMQLNVPTSTQQDQNARLAFYDNLETRLKAVPGVTAVGGTTRLPLGSTSVSTTLNVEGRATLPSQLPEVELRRAIFDYFGAMEIPIVRGRGFAPTDGPNAPLVGVVNTALLATVFPQEDPIGRRVWLGPNPAAPPVTIVGIIGSVRHGSLEETPRPELYLNYRQNPPVQPFIVMRTSTDPASLGAAVRRAVRGAGADPPFDVKTMLQIRDSAVAERRFVLWLVAAFGLVALALSAVGVYGVVTLIAAERGPEVSIRLALGARPTQVLTMLLAQGSTLAVCGIGIGSALSLVLAPTLSSQLFGVRAFDPLTYAAVALTLLIVATVAAYVPARRAMRLDPARTLR
jgi:putative ABC transport system permease protein